MSFIDEMGLGSAPAVASRGWSSLGSAIGNAGTGGGLRGEMAYEMGLQRGASAASALEEARLRRDKGLALSQLTPAMFTDPTQRGQLALLAARGGFNLNELGGGLGHLQDVDLKQGAMARIAAGGTIDDINPTLAVIDGKPVKLTANEGNTLINPYATPGEQAAYGGNVPTQLGMADIALRGAQTGAANASARERDAQTKRALAGIGVDKAANYEIVTDANGNAVRVNKLDPSMAQVVTGADGQPLAMLPKGGAGAAGKVSLPSPETLKQTFGENKIGGQPNDEVNKFIEWQALKAQTDPAYNNGNFALRQYQLEKGGASQAADQTASMADALGLNNTATNNRAKAGKITYSDGTTSAPDPTNLFPGGNGNTGSAPAGADPAHLDPGSSAGAATKGSAGAKYKGPTGKGGVPAPTNQAEYDALDPGAQYVDPNGVLRVKGQG